MYNEICELEEVMAMVAGEEVEVVEEFDIEPYLGVDVLMALN